MTNSLRDLQMCELEILKDIKAVCEKHEIKYYLSAGTLLGAVRHTGFIPWDDDVDIEIPYSDYLRFLEVAPTELGEKYFVQNSDTDPYSQFAYTQIRKNNTTMMREWEKTMPNHHGVWVDVFPLVYVGGDTEYRVKRLLLEMCTFLRMHDTLFCAGEKWYSSRSNPVVFTFIKLVRLLPEQFRWGVRNRIVAWICGCKEKSYVCYPWSNLSRRIPKEAYSDTAYLKFEDDIFPVPGNYDLYLSTKYRNYMTPPPEDKRTGHGDMIVDLERDWHYYCQKENDKC